jgi:hypothetical protein
MVYGKGWCFGVYTRLEETETNWLYVVVKISNKADFLKFYFVSFSIPLHEKIIVLSFTGAEDGHLCCWHFGLLVYGFVCIRYIILVF